MIRWLLIIFVLLASCEKEEVTVPPRPVKAIQVSETSSLTNQIAFPGTLHALNKADLSFRVDGTVIMRDVTVGYEAKKDEVLIRLDPREYELQVKKAKGQVESMEAQLHFATRDYERMKNIYEKDPGAISVSFLDRKNERVSQLKGELVVAESDLGKAEDNLSYTFLKAPFDGIIAAIYVENHEEVHAKQPVMRFLDAIEREMGINVPEKYINLLLEGKNKLEFEVRLDAFPNKVFSGSIKEIGTEASSTTQTYPVTLSLENVPVEISLLAGMSGRAILKQSKRASGLIFKIPKSAIFTDNNRTTSVWVVDPSSETVKKQAVTVDELSKEDYIIVRGGLTPGDWVVTHGTSFLSEGQQVKLVPEPSEL